MNSSSSTKIITVNSVTRVEGKAALSLTVSEGRISEVQLRIIEPPRLFEAMLEGRKWTEAPDMTARICGICPVAYQITAAQAMEQIAGIQIPAAARTIRRLLMCGEWIVSHTIHIYLLHAPDFLGYDSAVGMAKHHRNDLERGLALKEVGNEILTTLGGRSVHPITIRVGGVSREPRREELTRLKSRLQSAIDLARGTLYWVSEFPFPEFDENYLFFALGSERGYPLIEGHPSTNGDWSVSDDSFGTLIREEQSPHSTALVSSIGSSGDHYLTGPLARFGLHGRSLPPPLLSAIDELSIPIPCGNPFRSIQIRAIEVWFACIEALSCIEQLEEAFDLEGEAGRALGLKPCKGIGIALTEAPRGTLFQRYEIDDGGEIKKCSIIPPTAQNQHRIEDSLLSYLSKEEIKSDESLCHKAEVLIRSFDPCISCATHFLSLEVIRR